MSKKIYLSIPISHLNYDDQKEHAEKVARFLEEMGFEVLLPFNNGVPKEAHDSVHMRADFKMLLECDAIFMCKGFEDSRGCRDEFTIAADCHMEIIYECGHSEYYR